MVLGIPCRCGHSILGVQTSHTGEDGCLCKDPGIVDVKTGNAASTGQLIGRYLAYYVSLLPFGLGFIWVAFDERKQGWHDKLAGTGKEPRA